MGIRADEAMHGRRRQLSPEEREKLEQYVIRMKQRGYSERTISQSIPLTASSVTKLVQRLRAAGVEGI